MSLSDFPLAYTPVVRLFTFTDRSTGYHLQRIHTGSPTVPNIKYMDACASVSDSEGPGQPLALTQLLRVAFREWGDHRRPYSATFEAQYLTYFHPQLTLATGRYLPTAIAWGQSGLARLLCVTFSVIP